MCGIVGIASSVPAVDRDWLVAGRDAMRHRGPDDAGEWWSADGCVGFGHRRLAIIDLSPGGHQPMSDSTGDLMIVFNGEIYNFPELKRELSALGYAFRSESDTEVLLTAYRHWDIECLSRLNGMFAFALYDARRRRIFLARDRAGEKPLFYALTAGALRFSSELKGLMADASVPRSLDPQAIDFYLALGYVPAPHCILKGVNKLPPAHALTFDLTTGQSRTWRYWQVPEANPAGQSSRNDALLLDELEKLLEDAVSRQLVADVPVGVLLSGGVDSSLVAAMAVRAAPHVKTFTMRFPGHGRFDETEHARLIARHFQTDHIELNAADSSVELLPVLAQQFDEPIADSSMIPTYLVSRLTREHCTVALGGDGGDELFGGYSAYSRLLRMQRIQERIPLALRRAIAASAGGLLPVGFRGRNWLLGLGADVSRDLPWTATYFDRMARRRLLARSGVLLEAERVVRDSLSRGPDLLERATRMDLQSYLVEDILAKVDRASMLNSLEVRAPLLDYRLIEFAFARVPSRLKATVSDHKILLKQLAARVLPPDFDRQRKQGFSIPLAAWLQQKPWKKFFRDVLLGERDALFRRPAIEALLAGQDRGRSNSERLFALVIFRLWQSTYRISA